MLVCIVENICMKHRLYLTPVYCSEQTFLRIAIFKKKYSCVTELKMINYFLCCDIYSCFIFVLSWHEQNCLGLFLNFLLYNWQRKDLCIIQVHTVYRIFSVTLLKHLVYQLSCKTFYLLWIIFLEYSFFYLL